MSDLKPCPFCGAQPVVAPWHGGGPKKICVSCENDADCRVQPAACDDDPEVAKADWNRRAHDATETAALRKVRDEMVKYGVVRWVTELDAILKERE